jgi:predicted dehydrogenase
MSTPFRWGILGPGNIANKFADGLAHSPNSVIGAVASRTKSRADEFAKEFNGEKAYGSYEELAQDSSLDAIYIATPHSEHISGAKLCLEHGRPVLVEKPFTINAAQANEVIELARSKKVFLMEGMWTRFFPAMAKLRELVKAGEIGEVKMVHADFGFMSGVDPKSRLYDPALGGGALLDVGIYPVSFACMILGIPNKSASLATLGSTNVDEITGTILQYNSGAIAVLSTAIRSNTQRQVYVLGETGSIHVGGVWWAPNQITVKRNGKDDEVLDFAYPGSGFQFEADEVQKCVREGKLESEILPLSETLAIMKLLDEIRGQIGLKYPADR